MILILFFISIRSIKIKLQVRQETTAYKYSNEGKMTGEEYCKSDNEDPMYGCVTI